MSSALPTVAAPAKESPLVGMIAMGLVSVAGVVFTWLMWRMGRLAAPYVYDSGFDMEGWVAAVGLALGETVTVLFAASVVCWVAGCIIGVFAVATRAGRVYGVWAIILGALVPFAGYVALYVTFSSLVP